MENVIATLLQDFESGKMSRRQLIQTLALGWAAMSAGGTASAGQARAAGNGFKATRVDHFAYEVADYRRTRDFYVDFLGMTVSDDNGRDRCDLHVGDQTISPRNYTPKPVDDTQPLWPGERPKATKPPDPNQKPFVDHVGYEIADWNTERIKAELDRRGMRYRLTGGGDRAEISVRDPDGQVLQFSGALKPGDSLYKKKA